MDNRAAVDFWWSHGVTSGEATNGMASTCDFSKVGPLLAEEVRRQGGVDPPPPAAAAAPHAWPTQATR